MNNTSTQDRIKALPIWSGGIDIASLDGGLTNVNFVVTDHTRKYVVRIGQDIPEHHMSCVSTNLPPAAPLTPLAFHPKCSTPNPVFWCWILSTAKP